MESGIINLRAELHKKREEANKYDNLQKTSHKVKKEKPTSFNLANVGVSIRNAKDLQELDESRITDQNSRLILEQKSLLYDRLHGGVEALEDNSLNEKYLVNFQKKIVDNVLENKKTREDEAKRSEDEKKKSEAKIIPNINQLECKSAKDNDEWVEYTDTLGRSRLCMRKDLPLMQDMDKNLQGDESEQTSRLNGKSMESEDMRREQQRLKWEKQEQENALKKDIHYENVMFNEARTHGAGFMKFSHDEVERKAQMDLLKELRANTERSQASKQSVELKKKKLMESRLEKVRQRKRLKMGLPMKDTEDHRLKTPPPTDDEMEETTNDAIPPSSVDLGHISAINNKETDSNFTKNLKIRDWDIGKPGVGSTMSQEEWVDNSRKERLTEFAPPCIYEPSRNNMQIKNRMRAQGSNSNLTHSDSPSNNYRNEYTNASIGSNDKVCEQKMSPMVENYQQANDFNTFKYEDHNSDFAPPATYEYYGPSSFNSRHKRLKPQSSMEDAINKGLSNLRKMNENN